MRRPTLSLVVLGANSQELAQFKTQHVIQAVDELVLLSNPAGVFGGLGRIGNHHIDHARGEIIGIVHADTQFGQEALGIFARVAGQGRIAGIVGRALSGMYAVSHAQPAVVSTLDSCSVFFQRASGLRFDAETFDSFHCCVEDFCLQAAEKNHLIEVPLADATHLSVRYASREPAWRSEYVKYRSRLDAKWKHVRFAACELADGLQR